MIDVVTIPVVLILLAVVILLCLRFGAKWWQILIAVALGIALISSPITRDFTTNFISSLTRH